MTDQPGIDTASTSEWLAQRLPGAVPPFEFGLVAAGGSNLTYRVTDAAGGVWALRRPPVGSALATAHDMGREWLILEALSRDGSIPVPDAIAFCDDPDVTGAHFYVMGFVDGLILRDQATAAALDQDQAKLATDSLVEVQATMHTLDFESVGLGDLGRHDGYVQRQLTRWDRQVRSAAIRELPIHADLHERLVAAAPTDSRAPALVHGDFRFDNCVLSPDGSVIAVLDWELATIGDPVADFAWSLRYWADPDDELRFLTDAPTLAPVLDSRLDYLERYQAATGFDLSDLDYFEVFSWWKYASIVEGVYARRLAGSAGGMSAGSAGSGDDPELLAGRVDAMLAHAATLAGGVI